MAWQDRLREAAYTSPEGTRLTFEFEAVTRASSKRTRVFEFPNVSEAYVQDNGRGPQQFALRCLFSGDDHDLAAEAFEAALLERGVGRLEHPLYGTFDVVPLGTITRRDDLVDAANQSAIEVTFSTSVASVYPEPQVDLRGAVEAALLGLADAGAQQFEDTVDLATATRRENVKAALADDVKRAGAELGDLAAATEVRNAFRDAQDAINTGLDVLIGQPLALARQLAGLLQAPASAATGIRSRLEGYERLLTRIVEGPRATPWESLVGAVVIPGRRTVVANDFHCSILTAHGTVAGSVRSVLEHQFDARPRALGAAAAVLAQLDTVIAWQDQGFEALYDAGGGDLDTGASYQALQHAVALAAGYLVEISFTLVPERRLVLDRPRTIIDLAAELYGSVSNERLDFLIRSNDLSGSEILELPRGRELVYYA